MPIINKEAFGLVALVDSSGIRRRRKGKSAILVLTCTIQARNTLARTVFEPDCPTDTDGPWFFVMNPQES